jgi:hypothetical protein
MADVVESTSQEHLLARLRRQALDHLHDVSDELGLAIGRKATQALDLIASTPSRAMARISLADALAAYGCSTLAMYGQIASFL